MATGHGSSQSYKGNSVDRVFEVNEATQLSGNITDDSRANANHCDRTDKAKVSIEKAWTIPPKKIALNEKKHTNKLACEDNTLAIVDYIMIHFIQIRGIWHVVQFDQVYVSFEFVPGAFTTSS